MKAKTFALCIPHLPSSERDASLARLRLALGGEISADPTRLFVFTEKLPNHKLYEACWSWLAEQETDYGIILQDDVIPCAGFWTVLRNALEACPSHIVALNNCTPVHRHSPVADDKGLRWVTSNDGLVGHGYVMPTKAYRSLLDWRAELPAKSQEEIHEDTLIDLWAMHKKMLVWHPVPALIDHDSSLESNYETNTVVLRASVSPRKDMASIDWHTDALHAGRCYVGNHRLLMSHMAGDDFRARLERYYQLDGGRG